MPSGAQAKRVVWMELDYAKMAFKVTVKKKTMAQSKQAKVRERGWERVREGDGRLSMVVKVLVKHFN